ncbi:deoxyribonuclease-2-beta isoform X2 [Paralichthys olivaceus]|uniref:deoxyribonuclease-2-beta isoform X2 n=1 Tax=Paralichthys olivaceus TaxID=8255 RepID=UPI00097D1C8C|nr:PREDICTED: deoxyribonuclease-2-beta-like isoform X2 [Paralichthys olivaceus]
MTSHFSVCCQIVILFLCHAVCGTEISCRNEAGEPVDWFIIYKLPRCKIGEVGSGVDYMYLDSSVKSWQMSKFMINISQGAVANTLNQIYVGEAYKSNNSAYALYNDAPPFMDYIQSYGHTKGGLLFDRSQGFWLSHTVPHFPSFPERGYLYPSSGKVNGQTALCMTYQYEQFLHVAKQLVYLYPRFYNCSVPAAFSADLPQLAQLCDGSKPLLTSDKRAQQLVSVQGEKYLHRLGGSGPECRPAGGVVAEARSRSALQLLPAQTRHEHQEGSSAGIGPVRVLLRPLQVVCVTGLRQQRDLPGGHEQGDDPAEAWRGADLLLQPPDLQGFQTGGGLVH